MEKNKTKNVTKKLQNLVKDRKTPIVVTKQGTKKPRYSSGESYENYSYSSYNT